MSENVTPLTKGAPIPTQQHKPHPDVVKALEDLLEEARAGKVRALVYGVIDAYEHFVTGSCGEARSTSMVGVIEFCKARIIAETESRDLSVT